MVVGLLKYCMEMLLGRVVRLSHPSSTVGVVAFGERAPVATTALARYYFVQDGWFWFVVSGSRVYSVFARINVVFF